MTAPTHDGRTIVVTAAIDDSYIEPLLVALWSAGRRLSPGWSLHVFAIGYQISPESKQWLRAALETLPVRLEWTTLDLSVPRHFWPGIIRDGDITAYYRLFLADVLPDYVQRVIFLDADILVAGNLVELWNSPFEGHVLQAIPDAYSDLLHSPRLRQASVPFESGAPYFNAGVLLIDLRRWREHQVGQKASALLWKYGSRLLGRDQDALNCVLAGRWKVLPPGWNFHELPHMLFCWDVSQYSLAELRQAFANPKIIHFVGGWKPWGSDACQSFYEQWQAEAREAGVATKSFPLLRRLRQELIWAPHAKLNRYFWRDVVQAPNPSSWPRAAMLLLKCPWMLGTYPLWQAWVWCQYSRVRIGLQTARRLPLETSSKVTAKATAP
ncbi:MAG: glycosyltransferase family 8 protein [Acidobacteria bacterium]|nr:glycosyltransferase family 8 protein [Acidobacteriota bacterium]